ncbi:MAG: C69 family dipeptidase [Prevotellaceae bacterium]|jgi:dipeptidase|nr:C69 family dipeptidase [Prevotellaceae bacterium]
MKKLLSILVLFAALATVKPASGCTNFLVTKGASTDGSTFLSYCFDMHTHYGELYFWPDATYPEGTMLPIIEWDTYKPLGEIKQVRQTYSVVGNMNEHSLAISETTFGGRKELADSTGIMDYGAMIFVTLQRAKNAREAIKIMTELANEYGYYSGGESYSICDPNEVWILELIGKGTKIVNSKNVNKGAVWVAVRIPDGYVAAHANQARIRTFPLENGKTSISSKNMEKIFNSEVDVVYAHDVISFAKEAGYYNGVDKDFSFSDTYHPVTFSGARACEARVWSFFKGINSDMMKYESYATGHDLTNRMPLYIKADKKLSLEDIAAWMRDHYEGSVLDTRAGMGSGPYGLPYRWRPGSFTVDGRKYVKERTIATQQTAFWSIAQCRSWMLNAIGGILWFGVDDAANSCLTPIYCSTTSVPEAFAVGNGDLLTYSDNSAFWTFSSVAAKAYARYDSVSVDIRKVQQELERKHMASVKEIDKKALELYKTSPEEAITLLTDFSVKTASNMVDRWKELDHFLLVRYIDGGIKKVRDGKFERTPYGRTEYPMQPQFPDKFNRVIVEDEGETLKYLD